MTSDLPLSASLDTTGRFSSFPMPKYRRLRLIDTMGVATRLPLTPWLDMVNVPPRHPSAQAAVPSSRDEVFETFSCVEEVARVHVAEDWHDQPVSNAVATPI